MVEYWENFASHAFESTTQSVVSHCVLLKPNGAPVPCTFCFSIRRDIMDLPSIIIGEYSPTQRPNNLPGFSPGLIHYRSMVAIAVAVTNNVKPSVALPPQPSLQLTPSHPLTPPPALIAQYCTPSAHPTLLFSCHHPPLPPVTYME